MLGSTYDGEICSAARALEFVGERWSLLIIRDALFRHSTRFGDFQRSLRIASNVLAKRLEGFVAAGLMEKRAGDEQAHEEYLLTKKGRDMLPVIVALTEWGDRWAAKNGPPILYTHTCGASIKQSIRCVQCGPIENETIGVKLGPGFTKTKARKRIKERA